MFKYRLKKSLPELEKGVRLSETKAAAECSPDYQPVQYVQMEKPVSPWRTPAHTVVSQGGRCSMDFLPRNPQSYLQPMVSPCSFYLVTPK